MRTILCCLILAGATWANTAPASQLAQRQSQAVQAAVQPAPAILDVLRTVVQAAIPENVRI